MPRKQDLFDISMMKRHVMCQSLGKSNSVYVPQIDNFVKVVPINREGTMFRLMGTGFIDGITDEMHNKRSPAWLSYINHSTDEYKMDDEIRYLFNVSRKLRSYRDLENISIVSQAWGRYIGGFFDYKRNRMSKIMRGKGIKFTDVTIIN